MRTCCQCGTQVSDYGPKAIRTWCLNACLSSWKDANPVESEGWIRVESMTPLQRAELDALLGLGAKC